MNAWELVRYFVCLVLERLTGDEDTYNTLLGTYFTPEFEKMKSALLGKLGELTACTKRCYPLPGRKGYLSKIQRSRTNRQLAALKENLGLPNGAPGQENGLSNFIFVKQLEDAVSGLQLTSDKCAAADVIDQVQAYYNTSIVTFVDNVATLAIENCLLAPLEHIFTIQTVNDMNDEQIRNLAAERPHVQDRRNRLSEELEKLQTGLRVLNAIIPQNTSPQRPSIFGKYCQAGRNVSKAASQPSSSSQNSNEKKSSGDKAAPATGTGSFTASPFSFTQTNSTGTRSSTGSSFSGSNVFGPKLTPESSSTDRPNSTGLFGSSPKPTNTTSTSSSTAPPFSGSSVFGNNSSKQTTNATGASMSADFSSFHSLFGASTKPMSGSKPVNRTGFAQFAKPPSADRNTAIPFGSGIKNHHG